MTDLCLERIDLLGLRSQLEGLMDNRTSVFCPLSSAQSQRPLSKCAHKLTSKWISSSSHWGTEARVPCGLKVPAWSSSLTPKMPLLPGVLTLAWLQALPGKKLLLQSSE